MRYYNKKVMPQLKMAATEIVENAGSEMSLLLNILTNYSNMHIKLKGILNMI